MTYKYSQGLDFTNLKHMICFLNNITDDAACITPSLRSIAPPN